MSSTFRRLTDARRWIQETEAAILDGRFRPRPPESRKTLAELIDRYCQTVLASRGREGIKLTRMLQRWRFELGGYFVADVTPARLAEVRDRLAAEPTPRGQLRTPATVNRYLGALSHVYTVGWREWEWAESNPLQRVRRLTESRGRVRFLCDEECARLLAVCRSSRDHRLYALVFLAIATGARQGELLGLRWVDIDLERHFAVFHETKNGERRSAPLSPAARSVLDELASRRPARTRTDLVFDRGNGCALFPQKCWEDALAVAGLTDFRFHDLRHTAASYLAMSGATLAEMAEVLGHKTLAMVKRYAHLTDGHKAAVVARMNERFLAPGS